MMSAMLPSRSSPQTASQHAESAGLDLSYLSQYEIDGNALAETAGLATAGDVDLDMLASDGPFDVASPGSAPMTAALPPTASELAMVRAQSGSSDSANDAAARAGTPSTTAGAESSTTLAETVVESTSKRRPSRPSGSRQATTATTTGQPPGAGSANGQPQPERRVRHTPHLPSGHAPRAAPTTMYWSRAPVHGVLPLRKFRAHTVTLVDNHDAWVFGGCDDHGCSRDVYVLDTETFAWSAPELAGESPPPCRAHTATLVDGKRIFFFGGGAQSEYYDSLWILDTHTRRWSQVEAQGPRPVQRRAHTAVFFQGKIVVFGGGNGVKALNDVWTLDVATMQWSEEKTHGKKPDPRGYHTANLVGANMVVVGGSDGKCCFADIWVLNLDTMTWRLVETERNYKRLSHVATQVGSYLFVMGGHDSTKYSNELLLFNLITLQWESRQVAGRPPSVRAYQSAFLTDSRLFVMGGFDGATTFDDVHLLDLAASAYLPQVTSFMMSSN